MSCKKASYIIEKRAVAKINLREKLALKFHLMICKLCRKYESDSSALAKLLKNLHGHERQIQLRPEDLASIKQKLKR